MKVRSLKSNRKLIKGHLYDTDWFANSISNPNIGWSLSKGRIHLVDIGYYNVADFTLSDGNPIPQQDYDIRQPSSNTSVDQLKKGDIIVCQSDKRFKYLIKGGKYRIDDIIVRNAGQSWNSGSIKLEGYNRYLNWNNWTFRKLSIQESRDLALSQIFDQVDNFSVEFKRKFEQKQTKDKILLETIAKSLLDKYRHHLDIVDWGIEKHGSTYQINREDFDHLMDKSLKEIIELAENFSNQE
jgi:hypothetical protein